MSRIKYSIGSAMASVAMFVAPAVPVAADSNTENSYNNTTTTTVSESKTVNIGKCSVNMDDIKVWLDQYNRQNNDNTNVNVEVGGGDFPRLLEENGNYGGGEEDGNTSQSNSNSQNQANNQSVVITVSPDCSVTNVTKVESAGAVKGAQAEAAKGGVDAGVGGAAPSLVATAGALGSVFGLGLGIRRFGN